VIDGSEVDTIGIKGPTDPCQVPFVFFVPWICNGIQELRITVHATDILRRAGVLTVDTADCDGLARPRHMMLLYQDNVVPTVAEVVEIIEAARVRSEGLMKHNSALVRLLQLV
jgi:hypothetical protein